MRRLLSENWPYGLRPIQVDESKTVCKYLLLYILLNGRTDDLYSMNLVLYQADIDFCSIYDEKGSAV